MIPEAQSAAYSLQGLAPDLNQENFRTQQLTLRQNEFENQEIKITVQKEEQPYEQLTTDRTEEKSPPRAEQNESIALGLMTLAKKRSQRGGTA